MRRWTPLVIPQQDVEVTDINLAQLRIEFARSTLGEADVAASPVEQFDRWFKEAMQSQLREPYAMTLATADANGQPSLRVMMMRDYSERGISFFTNYLSRKGRELTENPQASLLFFWSELERQVRISGKVSKVSAEESSAYFSQRPVSSQVGAWASEQSQVIADRGVLETREARFAAEFGEAVPRPPHWGGFCVSLEEVEFWQ
ncbi:MAG: pyridoxamine 5'-phosphate oxidase, partial [Moraxellaceae bacterium]|nr:pyridoxamine 5'-phosphate oxidase [Moraxellaceae bacterium]